MEYFYSIFLLKYPCEGNLNAFGDKDKAESHEFLSSGAKKISIEQKNAVKKIRSCEKNGSCVISLLSLCFFQQSLFFYTVSCNSMCAVQAEGGNRLAAG